MKKIRRSGGKKLAHLFAADRLLQNDLRAAESALFLSVRVDMVFSNIGIFRFVDVLAANRAFSYGFGFAKFFHVDGLAFRFFPEIEVDLVVGRRSELQYG